MKIITEIPQEITVETLDKMIPIWKDLSTICWNGFEPYSGLCDHFEELGLTDQCIYDFLSENFQEYWGFVFLKPTSGKEGASVRLQVLQEIRKELIKKRDS